MSGTLRAWMKGFVMAAMVCGAAGSAMASDGGWTKPTPEELSMTSMPDYPGAPGVILNREEITKDDLHVMQHYERIKVLTEKGKEFANVELGFVSSRDTGDWVADEKNITDIQGRTIHPDGTVIPFTGKPYLKKYEKNQNYIRQARVFTLPDVEVGSIIEYRYSTRIADNVYESPYWSLQGEMYAKKVHFMWYPTKREIGSSSKGSVQSISWFQVLPNGAKLERRELPAMGPDGGRQMIFELTANDIPPKPTEDHMPPVASFTYRVAFYYSPYRNSDEFWKSEGKDWSKRADSFAGPDSGLREATQTVIAGANTDDEKLHKIYEAVMAMENTDYTREHGANENKAEGLGKVSNAFDVYKHKRGSGEELTKLFVGMARAAGMKAYMMLVTDRSERLFTANWLNFYQFDNMIAIVNVSGKEQYFDPGTRYCQYGNLAWQSTYVQGIRQSEKGTEFAVTPGDTYKSVKTQRIGDLTVDEHGGVTGTLTVSYVGQPALTWRQKALRGDEESLRQGLKSAMGEMMPKTLDLKVTQIENLQDYEKPLVAHFAVTGGMGTVTAKRLILPMDVFVAETPGTFPHEKREMPVYFSYAQMFQDAVRVKFPASMTLEAAPGDTKVNFEDIGQYTLSGVRTGNSITIRRNLLFNGVIVPLKDFGTLRNFYSQLESKDKDSIVLKAAGTTTATTGN